MEFTSRTVDCWGEKLGGGDIRLETATIVRDLGEAAADAQWREVVAQGRAHVHVSCPWGPFLCMRWTRHGRTAALSGHSGDRPRDENLNMHCTFLILGGADRINEMELLRSFRERIEQLHPDKKPEYLCSGFHLPPERPAVLTINWPTPDDRAAGEHEFLLEPGQDAAQVLKDLVDRVESYRRCRQAVTRIGLVAASLMFEGL